MIVLLPDIFAEPIQDGHDLCLLGIALRHQFVTAHAVDELGADCSGNGVLGPVGSRQWLKVGCAVPMAIL